NESSQSSAVSVTTLSPADTEAPSAPLGLSSSNVTVTGVELNWSASTDNVGVTGYKVYQDGSEITQVTGTVYSVTGLGGSTTYSFTVLAIDEAENESSQSSAVSVTTSTPSARPKVLVFTKTSGFNHGTESESVAMVEQIAAIQSFDVISDNDGSEFNTLSNLNQYDIIFFSNTSGDFLNGTQRANVESYAAQGGNFISNHAASDAYGHSLASTVSGNGKGIWDWYAENVTGCSVRNGPNHTSNNFGATVTIQNANSQLTSGISFPWNDNEEWYYWEGGYLNSIFSELLRVSDTGPNSYDDTRMTAQLWERPDGGTSFYTSMGHSENKYTDLNFVQFIDNVFNFIID
uniref:ThuA domain-containing protein n=1 Tax=Maribacter antarcticus TaxID=505250 RepID=UPI001B80A3F3